MKIVYFYQYFGTPKGSWSTRVYEMTRRWVQAGHEVTVVTSRYDKSDLKAEGFITKLEIERVRVILINIQLSNQHGFTPRLLSFCVYALGSVYYALRLPFQVCISSSGPISVGVSGLAAKLLRRKAFVFEIRDIWPAGAIQLGILRNPVLIHLAHWFEKLCYRSADLVVVCSPGQARHVRNVSRDKEVLIISNAADNDLAARAARQQLDIPDFLFDKRLVVYTGSLGLMDDCAQIVEAARVLQERARMDIAIVMIGSGNEDATLELLASSYCLRNMHFMGLLPKEQAALWLQQARAAFYTIKAVPVLNTGSPNKIFDAFASGIPLIQNSDGWIRTMIDEEGCGLNVPLGDAQAMADAVIRLCDDDALHDRCAFNARRLAQSRFDRTRLAEAYLAALKNICGRA